MKNVLLVGGGKIGVAITELLSSTGDQPDRGGPRRGYAAAYARKNNVARRKVDILCRQFIADVEGHDIVLSATPYNLTATVARPASARIRHPQTEGIDPSWAAGSCRRH